MSEKVGVPYREAVSIRDQGLPYSVQRKDRRKTMENTQVRSYNIH